MKISVGDKTIKENVTDETKTAVNTSKMDKVYLYPNPANGVVYVKGNANFVEYSTELNSCG